MRKSSFNDAQMIRMLQEHEGGVPTAMVAISCLASGVFDAFLAKTVNASGFLSQS